MNNNKGCSVFCQKISFQHNYFSLAVEHVLSAYNLLFKHAIMLCNKWLSPKGSNPWSPGWEANTFSCQLLPYFMPMFILIELSLPKINKVSQHYCFKSTKELQSKISIKSSFLWFHRMRKLQCNFSHFNQNYD